MKLIDTTPCWPNSIPKNLHIVDNLFVHKHAFTVSSVEMLRSEEITIVFLDRELVEPVEAQA